jgi:hypothetical protein
LDLDVFKLQVRCHFDNLIANIIVPFSKNKLINFRIVGATEKKKQ